MARIEITIPDDLLERSSAQGLDPSDVAAIGLARDLARPTTDLDSYLRELDAELGPMTDEERLAARGWADRELPPIDPADAARWRMAACRRPPETRR